MYGLNNKADPIKVRDSAFKAAYQEFSEELKEHLALLLPGAGDAISILWGASRGFTCFEIEEPFALAE